MREPSKLGIFFLKPLHQAAIIASMMVLFTLVDHFMPHDDEFFKANAGPWIVSTAMILLFIVINTVVALRIEFIIRYWTFSLLFFFVLLAFAYGWCYLLTGKHIDEVGSFRWLWMVLTMVYFVFFIITRSMKRIVDFALKQDEKLRGEE